MDMDYKVKEYKTAIEKYNNTPYYIQIEFCASLIIMSLQLITVLNLFRDFHTISFTQVGVTLAIAYIATDFINGFVHMVMDNNMNYTSITGPFIAAFHLHHSKLIYKNAHIFKVYFNESGHKLWLVFYLLILFMTQYTVNICFSLNILLVAIGVLSSVAELSHYWCHNVSQCNSIIRQLQKCNILLSMNHHKFHHREDNINYAFLNGMSDRLLNMIAKRFYGGYKQRSDKHVYEYQQIDRYQNML